MATDADAQAWIDDVILDGGTVRDENAIDNLVIKLKNDGIWAKLDHLWLRKYTGSEIAALKCLVQLTDSVNFGCVFNDDNGFTGDGVDDFIETNGRNGLTNLVQNSAHYGVKYKAGDGLAVSDERSGRGGCLIGKGGGAFLQYAVNNNGLTSSDVTDDDGFLVAVRDGASSVRLYRNGIQRHTSTDASAAPDGGDFGSLAYNGNSFSVNSSSAERFIGGTEEVVSIGGALTATDVTNLYAAITDFYNDVENPAPTGTTISGITQKDGVTLIADGTYVQHLYADDDKGTNETLLEVGQTTGGEVTFTGELPVGKVRFIRIAYQDAGRDVVKEQFFTD